MNRTLLSFSLAVSLCITSFTSSADYKQAVANYQEKNYSAAFSEFQSLAEIGNTRAQYNLGMMYLDGFGTKQDLVKAYAWIRLSDESDMDDEVQQVLLDIAKHFKSNENNDSIEYYKQIKSSYGEDAIVTDLKPIFDMSQKGSHALGAVPISTFPPNYPQKANMRGIEGYTKVEFNVDEQGQPYNISVIESFPEGVFDSEVLKTIPKWRFEQGSDNRSEPYHYKLEFKLSNGYSSKAKKLIKKIEKDAYAGDAVSQYYYAKYAPVILRDNKINRTEWYYKAAEQGIADAQYEVGLSLLNGQGCLTDKEKGLRWLTSAASADLGRSQFKLARLYDSMESTEDKAKGKFWLDKAIEAEDKEIALKLASYLSMRKDYSASEVIKQLGLLKEKKVSDPLSYYNLYARSYAELKDFEQAVKYQRKANKIMRRYGKVPKEMREKLDLYKSKSNS